MYIDADEMDEELSLDTLNEKRSRRSPKNKKKSQKGKHEYSVRKGKNRAGKERKGPVLVGSDNRGYRPRKGFLSAFSGRPSLAKQRGGRNLETSAKGRTR